MRICILMLAAVSCSRPLPTLDRPDADAGGGDAAVATNTDAAPAIADTGLPVADASLASCPATGGSLDVCECGCCGGAPEQRACYYPERGESTALIPDPHPSPSECATNGCTEGTRHVCCAGPGAPAAADARYCAHDEYTNLPRYDLRKIEGDVCTSVTLEDTGNAQRRLPISAPQGLAITGGRRGPCVGSASPIERAIGGLGSVTNTGSAWSIHVVLFFAGANDGPAEAVRMDSDQLISSCAP
jgi:hypothetical protein